MEEDDKKIHTETIGNVSAMEKITRIYAVLLLLGKNGLTVEQAIEMIRKIVA